MSTLAKQSRAATGLDAAGFGMLVGVSALTVHGWETGSKKPTARETEVLARILKGCARHGGPDAINVFINESLKADYLTALGVLLIDGAYAK